MAVSDTDPKHEHSKEKQYCFRFHLFYNVVDVNQTHLDNVERCFGFDNVGSNGRSVKANALFVFHQ